MICHSMIITVGGGGGGGGGGGVFFETWSCGSKRCFFFFCSHPCF
jgi:hypothetical protein